MPGVNTSTIFQEWSSFWRPFRLKLCLRLVVVWERTLWCSSPKDFRLQGLILHRHTCNWPTAFLSIMEPKGASLRQMPKDFLFQTKRSGAFTPLVYYIILRTPLLQFVRSTACSNPEGVLWLCSTIAIR